MKIRPIISLLFAFLLLPEPLYAVEKDSKPAFHINSPINPPEATIKHDGFEDMLAIELYTRLGFSPVIHTVPAERGLKNLDKGYDDAILSRIAGLQKSYSNIVQIDEPVNERKYIAFSRQDIKISKWDDLKGYHVTHVIGWKIFEKNVTQHLSLTAVREPKVMFLLLDQDRADVALYGLNAGLLLIKQLGLKDIHPVYPPLASKKKYFYVHKRHAHLVPQANKILRNMKSDGTFKNLRQASLNNMRLD